MIDPSTGFDAAFYLRMNPDVAAAGVDPLQHYRSSGFREGRNPSALFDVAFYLSRNPDVAAAGIEPLAHYMAGGFREGRNPHPLFQSAGYLSVNPDVAAAGINPLIHYATSGGFEGRDPHELFDSDFYLSRNPDVAAARINPLEHYLTSGFREGRDPHPLFDTDFYLATNADVAASGMNPLVHFVLAGQAENRNPNPLFDAAFYYATNPDVTAAGANAFDHYVRFGGFEGRDPHPGFDSDFYLARNPDVAAAPINPLVHFLGGGLQEGRVPKLGVGTAFDNILFGDANDNLLSGEGGNDILITGRGANTLTGGAGADEFRIGVDPNLPNGVDAFADLVTDFDFLGGDRIGVADYLAFSTFPADADRVFGGRYINLRIDGPNTVVEVRQNTNVAFRAAMVLAGVRLSFEDLEYYGFVTTPRDDAFRMVDSPFGFNGTINTSLDLALTPDAQYLAWSDHQNLDARALDLNANTNTFNNTGSTTSPTTYDVFLRNLATIPNGVSQTDSQRRVSVNALLDVIRTFESTSSASRFDATGAGISDDGRHAIFVTDGPVLSAFAPGEKRVYVRDMRAPDAIPVLASRDVAGGPEGVVARPAISGDGRWVAFVAPPPTGDTGFGSDLLMRDWRTGETRVVSVVDNPADAKNGFGGGGVTGAPAISGDGRYVAFTTTARLVAADVDTEADVYVRDTVTGRTTLLSGGQPGASSRPSISRDGTVVAFQSDAALDPDDANRLTDVYVARLSGGTLTQRFRLSEAVDGFEAEGGTGLAFSQTETYGRSFDPVVSPAGNRVAFTTSALDLAPYEARFFETQDRNGLGNNIVSTFERLVARDLTTGEYVAPAQRNFISQNTDPDTAQYALDGIGVRVAYQVLGPQQQGAGGRADFGDAPQLAPLERVGLADIGNTVATAAAAPVFVNSGGGTFGEFAVRSFIDMPGDVDVFFVDRASRLFDFTNVVVSVEGAATARGSLTDPVLRILRADGSVALSNDDGGVGTNARLLFNQSQFDNSTQGGYRIQVSGFGASAGSYRLSVTPVFQGDETAGIGSPGSYRTTSALLPLTDATLSNSLPFNDSEDWFQFRAAPMQLYRFDASSFNATLDQNLVLRMHDRNGNAFAETAPGVPLDFMVGVEDFYYLSISTPGNQTGSYTLNYDVI